MNYLFLLMVAGMVIIVGACALVAIGQRRTPDEIEADNDAEVEYLRKYAQSKRAHLRGAK